MTAVRPAPAMRFAVEYRQRAEEEEGDTRGTIQKAANATGGTP
jgi:hypothetical protein